MKQQKFVSIIFLLLAILTLSIALAPTPTPTQTLKSKSKNKTKQIKQEKIKAIDDQLCSHDGVRDILLKLASGYMKKLSKADEISLRANGVTIENGEVQSSIRKNMYSLRNGKFAVLECPSWLGLIGDYYGSDSDIPNNLK
jgi:hypothetical protein